MGSSFLAILLFLAAGMHFISTGNNASTVIQKENVSQHMESSSTENKKLSGEKRYASPPDMRIDPTHSYEAIVHTNKGNFTIQLFADKAPKTVNNFVFLAREGFYDNVVFHRVIESFMIQTGDPTGSGQGGPGYQFEDELSQSYKYEPGIVAMANAGANTNGSQFFICTGEDSRYLNQQPNYTIFGKISDGMDTILKLAQTKVSKQSSTGELSSPMEPLVINAVDIKEITN